jgi:ATP-dependent Lhr-like helicase
VLDALTLLPGWPASLDAWQHAILPARTLAPPQAELTALLRSGAYSWVIDGRRIRLIPRGEGALYLVPPDDAALATLSADAQRVRVYLQAEGASLLDDVCAGTGLVHKRAIDALSELAQAGLATADAFAAIGAALADRDEPHAAVPRGQQSALAADLAERLGARSSPPQAPGLRRPSVSAMRNARQRVRTRMSVDLPAPKWSEPWRWSLVHRAALLGPARSDEVRVIAVARGLLARYGIVTREIRDFDGTPVAWADLYDQLQRLEMRGEIRRGYFVEGLSGVQFAEPDALERLRGAAQTVTHSDRVAVVSALDPVLVAIEADQALRLTRIASTQVALWRGRAVLTFMDGGVRVTQEAAHDGPAPQAVIDAALRAWLGMQPPGRRIVVSSWNGESPLGTPAETTLARAGFGRDPNGMSVYR